MSGKARSPEHALIAEFAARRPLRASSVIVSLFGDVVVPRGGQVWLGSVIRLLEPLGLSERLVRTSVSRLVGEGWLEAVPKGRRSDYRLTDEGSRRFAAATRRIYQTPSALWDGHWRLVFVDEETAATRRSLRAELGWLGFAALAPGVFAHPSPDEEELQALFEDEDIDPLQMTAKALPDIVPATLAGRVAARWELEELEARYNAFAATWEPLVDRTIDDFPGDLAFQVRLILLHDYRRLLLRDPDLPRQVLGEDWPGDRVRQQVSGLYRRLSPATDDWLRGQLERHSGPLPLPDRHYARRFGGLAIPASNQRKVAS